MMALLACTAACRWMDGNQRMTHCTYLGELLRVTKLICNSVEHQRRSPNCEFFRLFNEWEPARKQGKGRKGRASRGSKASRLSTQSNITFTSEAPSILSLEDAPAELDDSILTTATNTTTASTTGKGRKKAAAKGKAKSVRGSKKAEQTIDSSIMDVERPEPVIEEIPVLEEPPKRQTRRKASRTVSSQLEDTVLANKPQKVTRAKAIKGKSKQRLSDDESQLQSELQAAVDSSLMDRETTPKPKRGTKRMSDGTAKMDSSIVMLPEAPSDFQAQQDKAKRGRKPKKQPTIEAEARTSGAADLPQRVSSAPKGLKASKGKKAAKHVEPTPEPEPETEPDVQYPDLEVEDVERLDFAQSLVSPSNPYAAEDEEEQRTEFAKSLAEPANPYESVNHTPEPAATEPSPSPSTPTPARHSSVRIRRTQTPAKIATPVIPHEDVAPTPSPQSSDAENHPPSSRLSARQPLSVQQTAQRIPLADTTPDHATMSPSKRNILNNITSTMPWSPTDLETVFLNSPVKANLALNSVSLNDWDKENQAALDAINLDKLDKKTLEEVVKRVKGGMGDEEKKMSVEEWVRWNATRGEERLKGECEGMVSMFEREGGRALGVLEGIVCLE
jgi:hypothetical protein